MLDGFGTKSAFIAQDAARVSAIIRWWICLAAPLAPSALTRASIGVIALASPGLQPLKKVLGI
jgi:hypothetical protein